MLDDNDGMEKLSRYFVRKGMSDCTTAQLTRLLLDVDPIVRTCAGFQLHLLGRTADDFAPIAALTSHPEAYVREVAAYVLGQLGTPDYPFKSQSVPLLAGLTKDPNEAVRSASIYALMHLGGNDARRAVLAAVSDVSADVRCAVAWCLPLIDQSGETVTALESLLADASEDVRLEARTSLDELSEPQAAGYHGAHSAIYKGLSEI